MPDIYVVGYDGKNIMIPARLPLTTAHKVVELAQEHLRHHGPRIDADLQLRQADLMRGRYAAGDLPTNPEECERYWMKFTVTLPDEPSIFDMLLIESNA